MENLIKWTGTKRYQAKEIVSCIPNNVTVYHELFLGSGAVFYHLLESNKRIKSFVVNDRDTNLINLHRYLLYTDAEEIAFHYDGHRRRIVTEDAEYYYLVRRRFNELKTPELFLVLNRNCVNGLVRYNSKGEFNSPFHHNRKGMETTTLKKIVLRYQELVKGRDITFTNQSYTEFQFPTDDGGFVYLDPPYSNSKNSMYGGSFDFHEFDAWLATVRARFLLSYNSISENDYERMFTTAFKTRRLVGNSKSSFKKLFADKNVPVSEYLYSNY